MTTINDQYIETKADNGELERNRQLREIIEHRLCLLSGNDRLIMTMYIQHYNTIRQMAQLSGITPSRLYRHLKKIKQRLLKGPYINVVRNRWRFSDIQLAIACDYLLCAISQKAIARNRKMSLYAVKKTLNEIDEILQQLSRTKTRAQKKS